MADDKQGSGPLSVPGTAEERLRESEGRLRTIAEHAPDTILQVNRDGIILFVNRPVPGLSNDDIVGSHVFRWVPPEQHDVVAQALEAAFTQRTRQEYESAGPGPHGDASYYSVRVMPVVIDGEVDSAIYIATDITERRRAEEALRVSEARLATILDNVGACIFIKDTEYRYTYANRMVCELFGQSAEEIIGRNDGAFYSPASVEEIMRSDRPVIEQGETVARQETDLTSADGQPRTYWTVKLPLRDLGGELVGLCGISTDITERIRAEEALRESENRTRSIIESIPVGMHMYRLEGDGRLVFVGANPAADRILGVDNRIFVGKAIEDAFPGLAATEVPRRYREVVQTGVAWQTESIVYEDNTVQGAFDVYAFRTGLQTMVAAFTDVTEKTRAQFALKESERSLKTLMGNLPGMAYRCRNDRNWTMEYASDGTAALTGYLPEELIGNARLAYNDIVHPEDRELVWESVQSALEHRTKFTLQYRIRRADGQERWVWEQGQGVFDDAGKLIALEGFIIDTTERRLLDEERVKSQKLESIGTLAGGIAHDFNNLLQGVFGYISLAKSSTESQEELSSTLEEAEQALHQAVNLTSQLLAFSKGGKPIRRLVELPPVIASAARFALSGSRASLRQSFDDGLWSVEADAGQIGQIIQNVVLNADQAMPEGGTVEIRASNLRVDEPRPRSGPSRGSYVAITVKDHGVGIPPENLPLIFDPYFTTKPRGSGLGLATSYAIARNHGGLLTVQSKLGEGSTFTLYLPAEPGQKSSTTASQTNQGGRLGRVLIMDDDEIVRKVTRDLVRALGHAAETACSGDEAVAIYSNAMGTDHAFDIVILDLTVRAGMGGAEAMRRLRALDPEVVAIVSSGYSNDSVIAHYRDHGFRAFLAKPYGKNDLQKLLHALLR